MWSLTLHARGLDRSNLMLGDVFKGQKKGMRRRLVDAGRFVGSVKELKSLAMQRVQHALGETRVECLVVKAFLTRFSSSAAGVGHV